MAITKAPAYAALSSGSAQARAKAAAALGLISPIKVGVPKAAPPPAPYSGPGLNTNFGYQGGSVRYPVGATGTIADYRSPAIGLGPTTYTDPTTGTLGAMPPGGYGVTTPDNPGGEGGSSDTGFNPNAYLTEYKNDPRYLEAQDAYNTSLQAGRNALRNALQQNFIRGGFGLGDLGSDPRLASYLGDIDPTTAAAAASNPMSARAQLQHQLDVANASLPWELTARGAARSGAAAAGLAANTDAYKSASYNAIQDLLGSLLGNVGDYGTGTTNALSTFNTATNDVISRLAQIAGYHQATDAQGNPLPANEQPTWDTGGSTITRGTSTPSPTTASNVQKTKQYLASIKSAMPTGPTAVARAKTAAARGYITPSWGY